MTFFNQGYTIAKTFPGMIDPTTYLHVSGILSGNLGNPLGVSPSDLLQFRQNRAEFQRGFDSFRAELPARQIPPIHSASLIGEYDGIEGVVDPHNEDRQRVVLESLKVSYPRWDLDNETLVDAYLMSALNARGSL